MPRTRLTLMLSLLLVACGLLSHFARAQQAPTRRWSTWCRSKA